MRSACLPQHPAVAYLRLVRPVNRVVWLLCILSLAGVGCVSVQDPSGRVRYFAVEGPRDALSAADLKAIVAEMADDKIYRLRIIDHNRVEVDTSPKRYQVVLREGTPPETRSTEYVIFKRENRDWRRDGFVVTTF